jgi:hypothetical protein
VGFKGKGVVGFKGGEVVGFKGRGVVGSKSEGEVEFMEFSGMTGWHRSCHVSDESPR